MKRLSKIKIIHKKRKLCLFDSTIINNNKMDILKEENNIEINKIVNHNKLECINSNGGKESLCNVNKVNKVEIIECKENYVNCKHESVFIEKSDKHFYNFNQSIEFDQEEKHNKTIECMSIGMENLEREDENRINKNCDEIFIDQKTENKALKEDERKYYDIQNEGKLNLTHIKKR